ncbi:MAG: hypothetical protein HOQ02_04255 [Lysobacter sp.]|nr:hypothetical protein [Lysobacter sp.]
MRPRRILHAALLPLLPVALFALGWLGLVAFRQALQAGWRDALLMAWTLAFVVGLPLALVPLAVAGRTRRGPERTRIIPSAGGKIP